ncbi:biotin--[acetyl-CoA-carboxylase] ligase [Paraflavitalea sp. CAU 1676]|uniref:biotin--[acetyl-CoA-carboxylase] ligase n=1 Tax=Paraflavitalea sp. CAU 1676 TaxID=3032598 RepID=UPI0023DC0302|nr:biotin--[acetyl-CoA-carboxylase] ligase [Paraflavitalea sp. CAU 1676]MDF2193629.1 biotin--[acetyl-CoA-carboxylase] ligase [Paraflavitalea sp. CAU 1676]
MPHPAIGQQLIILPVIDSTNNYAMAQAAAGKAPHGNVYFTLEQTAGKGQRGKTWHATPGENIMMSVVIYPESLITSQQFLLSAAIALGCYDFFKIYAGEETRIKWPNDLYWRDRKAGGILIESRIGRADQEGGTPAWLLAIAGMGININQTGFTPQTLRPVSLKQITGKTYDIIPLAKELCQALENRYQALQHPQQLLADYHQALYKYNETVKLKKDNIVFETTIRGVTADGRLHTQDTIDRWFGVGEVEWVIHP